MITYTNIVETMMRFMSTLGHLRFSNDEEWLHIYHTLRNRRSREGFCFYIRVKKGSK